MISKKALTEQLRELKEGALIIRERFAEIPSRVEYLLSEKGMALLPVLKSLSDWIFNTFSSVDFEPWKIVNSN